MDEVGTATLSVDGEEQVVHLPEGFRLPGRELRVTRVGDGLSLRPVASDVDAWRAKLDAFRDIPFMEEGRQQPPMPDGDYPSTDDLLRHECRHCGRQRGDRLLSRRDTIGRCHTGSLDLVHRPLRTSVWHCPERSGSGERHTIGALPEVPDRYVGLRPRRAEKAGDMRATLERAGTPIGPYDVLIAAEARRHGATLVTADIREFARVQGLAVEDWSAP